MTKLTVCVLLSTIVCASIFTVSVLEIAVQFFAFFDSVIIYSPTGKLEIINSKPFVILSTEAFSALETNVL